MKLQDKNQPRFIFVMGGVLSGLGKGIATSSIAKLLQSRGFSVTAIKIDPYLNVDAGTMNPTEHGEVFVTRDGLETDQDVGNYERFLDIEMVSDNYMTQGMVWKTVIEKERNLDYHGACVQPWHHIPEEIIRRIKNLAKKSQADFILIEIGGTVGEYENLIFLEAGRRLKLLIPTQVLFVMVSYLPVPSKIGEMKTKPTQTAVQTLNAAGIQPDFILTRSSQELDKKRKEKISLHCSVDVHNIISSHDVDNIYEVPIVYKKQHFDDRILEKFNLKSKPSNLIAWNKRLVVTPRQAKKIIKVGMVGKYFTTGDFTLVDSYISVIESIKSAVWAHNVHVVFDWISSEKFEKNPAGVKELSKYDAIVVPGGFGERGVEGIIKAIKYAREKKIPYLGLCYGMQLATIEFARHVAGIKDANTTENKPKIKNPVIDVMEEQKNKLATSDYGGTMRLGDYLCVLTPKTHSAKLYGNGKTEAKDVVERHRHRYEFNNAYRKQLEQAGLVIAGINPKQDLVEIIELPKSIHPYFVGVQFHPEFKSRPMRPHPIFYGLIQAAVEK